MPDKSTFDKLITLFINVSGAVADMLERSVLKWVQSPEAR